MERNESLPAAQLRASDADRDQVAERLGEALAEGRLTAEEHAERLDSLYSAKTYAELEPLTSDLPVKGAEPKISLLKATQPVEALPPERKSSSVVAIFGGADRKGRWLAEPHTSVTCLFGGINLDYRNAVLTQREVTVNVVCLFGGVEVTVPPGVRVESSISAVFGGVDDPGNDTVDPNAPVLRFTGFVMFGGLSFKRKLPREQRKALRAQRREERRRQRGC